VTGHTYLSKSRHGVYYFRAVLPKGVRAKTERREVRISLRTKDRAKAKVLVAVEALRLTETLSQLETGGTGDHGRPKPDLVLVENHGEIDLGETGVWGNPARSLNLTEVRNHVLARDNRTSLAAQKAAPPLDSLAAVVPTPTPAPPVKVPHVARFLSDAIEERVEKVIERFVDNKKQAISAPTADKYGAQCRVFLKIVADGRLDLKISELTPKDVRAYIDILPKLPTRVDSSDGRPLEAILRSDGPRLSAKTIFAHAQSTNMFLTWCEAQQYPVRFNFHSILKPLLKKPRIKSKKKVFSAQQLKTLFESEPYSTGTFKRASDYWVPLLGLFTGAREAELCQLETNDVRQDAAAGLWLLDINSDDGKRLKTGASAREVPVHPTLIELGFLEFVDGVRASETSRLFEADQRNKRGEFSGFSKRFNRYKEGLGIKSGPSHKLDFHSFRHTLQTMLFDAGEEEYVVNALCGHNPAQRSEGVRTYSSGPGLEAKYKLLLKLKFGIDFRTVQRNGWMPDPSWME